MCYGVTRPGGRGIPKCLMQLEQTTKTGIARERGTLKVAHLKGDGVMPGLIAASLHDVKPFYFLTNACRQVKWIKKKRFVWNKALQKKVQLPFYRLNVVDEHNNNVNNVDIADQLRLACRFDRWMRKRKWWWSIFFWSFETLLTNAYICYKKHHLLHNSKPMSHFNFQRSIAMAWICPEKHWPANGGSCMTVSSVSTTSSARKSNKQMMTRSDIQSVKRVKRSPAFSDSTLSNKGALHKHRLENCHHWPIASEKVGARCQLHRWAANKQVKSNLMVCSNCNVTLCAKCFTPFHTILGDLVENKEYFSTQYAADNNDK